MHETLYGTERLETETSEMIVYEISFALKSAILRSRNLNDEYPMTKKKFLQEAARRKRNKPE